MSASLVSPRIVFMGTPDFAVPSLQALLQTNADVVAVYTQPDRPAGRGKKLSLSPVKACALANGIQVIQPLSLKTDADQANLSALKPDLIVVTAYGMLLPQAVLDLPTLGCVNVHASLLPRWRGAAPIHRAIEHGDTETGVTLMQMSLGLDTGPMLAKSYLAISPDATGSQLHDQLSTIGGQLLADSLPALLARNLTAETQDDSLSCYAKKLNKAETLIDWQQSAADIHNKIRAFNAWPTAITEVRGKALRLHDSVTGENDTDAKPGEVTAITKQAIHVQTGDGTVALMSLQKPGGKILPCAQFLNGFPLNVGDYFG